MKYIILLVSCALISCQPAGRSTMLTDPQAYAAGNSPNMTQIAGMSMYDLGHAMSEGRVDIYDPALSVDVASPEIVYQQSMPTAPVDTIEVHPVDNAILNDGFIPPPPPPPVQTRRSSSIAPFNNPEGSTYRQRPLMTYDP